MDRARVHEVAAAVAGKGKPLGTKEWLILSTTAIQQLGGPQEAAVRTGGEVDQAGWFLEVARSLELLDRTAGLGVLYTGVIRAAALCLSHEEFAKAVAFTTTNFGLKLPSATAFLALVVAMKFYYEVMDCEKKPDLLPPKGSDLPAWMAERWEEIRGAKTPKLKPRRSSKPALPAEPATGEAPASSEVQVPCEAPATVPSTSAEHAA